jgi:hypothetical protein
MLLRRPLAYRLLSPRPRRCRGGIIRLARAVSKRHELLAQVVPKNAVGAEIGVWKGGFSARILEHLRPRKLHLIDPWRFVADEEYGEALYGSEGPGSQAAMDAIYEGVLRRFADEISSRVVEVHRSTSEEASAVFTDGYFDWVYVDGNHLYEFVRRDLQLFEPKVRDGGVIAGDDYDRPDGWWDDGVTRAVDEFVAARGHEVISLKGHQFVLRKPPRR